MTFADITEGSPFTLVVDGVSFNGKKVRPFPVLRPERSSFLNPNAILIPVDKSMHGSEGYVAVIPDSTEICHSESRPQGRL